MLGTLAIEADRSESARGNHPPTGASQFARFLRWLELSYDGGAGGFEAQEVSSETLTCLWVLIFHKGLGAMIL